MISNPVLPDCLSTVCHRVLQLHRQSGHQTIILHHRLQLDSMPHSQPSQCPFDCLPLEMLSCILLIAVQEMLSLCWDHAFRLDKLAVVSCRWKDAIPKSGRPTIVAITPECPISYVEHTIKKCQEHLLDIVIHSWNYAHRWRSLVIWRNSTHTLQPLTRKLGVTILSRLSRADTSVSLCSAMDLPKLETAPTLQ